MQHANRFALLAACLSLALLSSAGASAPQGQAPQNTAPTVELLLSRPFTLERPYRHRWSAERPLVSAGYLVVLSVPRDLAEPREDLEPVLYFGQQTAERINHGHLSGRLVAIVPSALDAEEKPALDIASSRVFFGTPALPEKQNAEAIEREHDAAISRGVRPIGPEVARAARERGGELLALQDASALHREAARLLLQHSPADREQAEGMLAPLLERR